MKAQKDFKSVSDFSNFEEKTVAIDCKIHGKVSCNIFYFGKAWSEPYCPKCAEEKKAEEERQEEQRKTIAEQKAKQQRIERRLKGAMLPKKFKDHSFDSFKIANEGQKTKLSTCREYANNFPDMLDMGTSMIFTGNTGTGKTHLACSIANHIILNHDKAAVFLRVIKAIRQVKECYKPNSERTEQEAIDWFIEPDLLILDEIGVQFGSDAEKLILFEILNERYENLKPTILISNLSIKNLAEYLGDRIIDRMKENQGKILVFNWESMRK